MPAFSLNSRPLGINTHGRSLDYIIVYVETKRKVGRGKLYHASFFFPMNVTS